MFTHLSNLAFKRSPKEAFGFFVTYTIVLVILKVMIGLVTGMTIGNADDQTVWLASQLGDAAVALVVIILCFSILGRKHRLASLTILISVFGGIFAVVTGPLLAALIPAILTMLKLPEQALSVPFTPIPAKRANLVPGAVAPTSPAIPSIIYPAPAEEVTR